MLINKISKLIKLILMEEEKNNKDDNKFCFSNEDIENIESKIQQGLPLTEKETKIYNMHFNNFLEYYSDNNKDSIDNKIQNDDIDKLFKEFGVDLNKFK